MFLIIPMASFDFASFPFSKALSALGLIRCGFSVQTGSRS